MTTMIQEPKCIALKRCGAEYVSKLIAGMSLQEQLKLWQKRTEIMLNRQKSHIGRISET